MSCFSIGSCASSSDLRPLHPSAIATPHFAPRSPPPSPFDFHLLHALKNRLEPTIPFVQGPRYRDRINRGKEPRRAFPSSNALFHPHPFDDPSSPHMDPARGKKQPRFIDMFDKNAFAPELTFASDAKTARVTVTLKCFFPGVF